MAKTKEERQKEGAKRTRGNFVSVYQLTTVDKLIERFEAGAEIDSNTAILVQVIDENAACSNNQEARAEAAKEGITGTLVASRRCGAAWQRVEQVVMKDVEVKNVDGFNEVHVEPRTLHEQADDATKEED